MRPLFRKTFEELTRIFDARRNSIDGLRELADELSYRERTNAANLRAEVDEAIRGLVASPIPKERLMNLQTSLNSGAEDGPAGADPLRAQIEKLRARLLDTSGRNRLISFRPTKRSTVEFLHPDSGTLFDRLSNEDTLTLSPGILYEYDQRLHADKPQKKTTEFVETRKSETECHNALSSRKLTVAHDLGGLSARASFIRIEANSIIDETGLNHLYVVLGTVRWTSAQHSDEEMISPLVLIPVSITKFTTPGTAANTVEFRIAHDGGEIATNRCFAVRVARDHNIVLPELKDDVPLDEYFAEVDAALKHTGDFEVRKDAYLAFFFFNKLRMWQDLDPDQWPASNSLLGRELVQAMLRGTESPTDDDIVQEDTIEDSNEEAHSIPLMVDADSSQHAAILKVWQGQNLVIQGPPGTGKSQSITNIIAAAMYQNKTVLFVSEKLAALDVVQRNLQRVGLGDFCLELHSKSSNKKQVLASIARRRSSEYRPPEEIGRVRDAWGERIRQLTGYVDNITRVMGPEERMLYSIFGRAALLRSNGVSSLGSVDESHLLSVQYKRAQECLRDISAHFNSPAFASSHPWWGFAAEGLDWGCDAKVDALLANIEAILSDAVGSETSFAQECHVPSPLTPTVIENVGESRPAWMEGVPGNALPGLLSSLLDDQARSSLREHIVIARREQDLVGRASSTLVPGVVRDSSSTSSIRAFSDEACQNSLQQLSLTGAASAVGVLKEACELLQEASVLAERLAPLRLTATRTLADLLAGLDRVKQCAAAPEAASVHLVPHLARVGAQSGTNEAHKRSDALITKAEAIKGTFDLSACPKAAEILNIRKALRVTGGGFFSFFSKEYRTNRLALFGFLRDRRAFKLPTILDQLEKLEEWKSEVETFADSPTYKTAFGPLFRGIDTDWKALGALAKWAEALAQFGFPWEKVAETAEPARQIDLKEWVARIEAIHSRMIDLEASVPAALRVRTGAASLVSAEFVSGSKHITQWADWLDKLLVVISPQCKDQASTLAEISEACACVIDASLLRNKLDSSPSLPAVAGEHARGSATDWDGVEVTCDYVDAIVSTGFPHPLVEWLLSSRANDKIARLRTAVETMFQISERLGAAANDLDQAGSADRRWLWGDDDAWDGRLENIRSIRSNLFLLQEWVVFRSKYQQACTLSVGHIVDLALDGSMPGANLCSLHELAVAETLGHNVLAENQSLKGFSIESHESVRDEFQQRDRQLLNLNRKMVAHTISRRRVPMGTSGGTVGTLTEKRLLDHELGKQTKHIPIRQLLMRASGAIRAWKPCMMMSPLSVAQYLDPSLPPFDLIVMDEASQIRPEDALGAIARGKQLVVVGDSKQMPPSDFWMRKVIEDDLDDSEEGEASSSGPGIAQDAESILQAAESAFGSRMMLTWHYRSEHESLIQFSNHTYYDQRLIIFPAPGNPIGELGIKHHYVSDGKYSNSVNHVEALTVARAALDHICKSPHETLMIATVNQSQMELIERLLEQEASSDLSISDALEKARSKALEPLVVKNLENVQGDERDVVFISFTYGPSSIDGVVHQRFGPISGGSGQRRLNVLFTRARKRVEVFTSMRYTDVISKPGEACGPNDLRNYLRFAESGTLYEGGTATGETPESFLETAIMAAISSAGFQPIPQIGVSKYRIDIGVRHPDLGDEFILGVECDGAAYHSSRNARDRDRLRQEALERRGWKIHRIWSTDWFRHRESATTRLYRALADALKSAKAQAGSDQCTPVAIVTPVPVLVAPQSIPIPATQQSPLPIRSVILDAVPKAEKIVISDLVTFVVSRMNLPNDGRRKVDSVIDQLIEDGELIGTLTKVWRPPSNS